LLALVALACAAVTVHAQTVEPLTSKSFTWGNLPYQVDPVATGRGPQSGYNICNSTTAGQTSQCQTLVINSLADFCLWGAPVPDSLVGVTEAASVAYCSQPGWGTRLIGGGTLMGAQFLVAPAYVQITGVVNNTGVELAPGDTGGEMDPHGDDERGNPLGGLVFSNAFAQSNGNKNDLIQVVQWHNFMGSNIFCFKACNPAVAGSAAYCLNIYDTEGCGYNAPAAYAPGVFETCDSDNQTPPGTIAPGGVVPLPATSNCVTAQSTALYTALTVSTSSTSTSAAATTTPATSSSSTAKPSSGTSGGVAVMHGNYAGLLTVMLGGAVLGALAVFF